MFIHFEDWTVPLFLSMLEAKGMPHAGRIMKVYATYQDPRELMDRPYLTVLESDHSPFRTDEVFRYEGRQSYTGDVLEEKLKELGLQLTGMDVTRSLFRFANQEDTGFCQAAMAAQYGGKWLFDHPFQDLDGVISNELQPNRRITQIHLDIFYPTSIERLRKIVDFVDNPQQVLTFREHSLLDKAILAIEGPRRHPEK